MSKDLKEFWRAPQTVRSFLADQAYVVGDDLATLVFLALKLGKPLLIEGEPGVGKTELAKACAAALSQDLLRLQCYEGIDQASALYDWAYSKQLLAVQRHADMKSEALFSEDFLLKRPLLQALESGAEDVPRVLLIDEIDRADAAFEAFLLEFLSEFQVSIPEMGQIKAERPPLVILTSNRTREIHDALKRRCLYHWLDYPDFYTELAILRARLPGIDQQLSLQVVAYVQHLRSQALFKPPGIAEAIDWAQALVELDAVSIEPWALESSVGVLLKYQDDIVKIQDSEPAKVLQELQAELKTKSPWTGA